MFHSLIQRKKVLFPDTGIFVNILKQIYNYIVKYICLNPTLNLNSKIYKSLALIKIIIVIVIHTERDKYNYNDDQHSHQFKGP